MIEVCDMEQAREEVRWILDPALEPSPPKLQNLARCFQAQAEALEQAWAALEGEAVKISEYDGEWTCSLCGTRGEEHEPVVHKSVCALARIAALTGRK